MKKLILSMVVTLFVVTFSFAQDAKQNATKVSKFEEGTTLSKADIAFLAVVASGPEKSRGAAATSASVGKSKFTEGQKITKAEADLLNKKATSYGKKQKEQKDKTRGAVCYYLYCDGYGNCYYIYYYC